MSLVPKHFYRNSGPPYSLSFIMKAFTLTTPAHSYSFKSVHDGPPRCLWRVKRPKQYNVGIALVAEQSERALVKFELNHKRIQVRQHRLRLLQRPRNLTQVPSTFPHHHASRFTPAIDLVADLMCITPASATYSTMAAPRCLLPVLQIGTDLATVSGNRRIRAGYIDVSFR